MSGTPTDPSARRLARRLAAVGGSGIVAALIVGLAGAALERSRLGGTANDTIARLENELQDRFDASAATLTALTAEVGAARDLLRSAARDPDAATRLFELIETALTTAGDAGLTVYTPTGQPLAWGGRVSGGPAPRADGPLLFVTPGAPAARLVRVEPVGEPDRPGARVVTLVAEQVLAQPVAPPGLPDAFSLPTSVGSVVLRPAAAAAPTPATFAIRSAEGQSLVDGWINPEDLDAARSLVQRRTRAWVLTVLGLTVALLVGPLLDRRRLGTTRRSFVLVTAAIGLLVVGARLLLRLASAQLASPLERPAGLLLDAVATAALVGLAFDVVERWRLSSPRARVRGVGGVVDPLRLALPSVAAGLAATVVLWAYVLVLGSLVASVPARLLYFSLHPWEPDRVVTSLGLVILHAAVVWGAALWARVGLVLGRPPAGWPGSGLIVTAWLLGAFVGAWALRAAAPPVPLAPLAVAVTAAGVCASAVARLRRRVRHASQAVRLGVFYLALLAPAAALYPALHAFSADTQERLVAEDYGPSAANLRDDLQESLGRALEAVDGMENLSLFLTPIAPASPPATEPAFQLWSQTDLARLRLTSAVELYGRDGQLLSRFALNLPDYSVPSTEAVGCDWEILDEASFFGSAERHVLRASRGICEGGPRLGSVVVRAMLDYGTLPFVASQSPYLESLTPDAASADRLHGTDLEVVVYGWSRAPLELSGRTVFPLSEEVFQRMVVSRDPFWTTVERDDGTFRVYFMNDRGGIYAVGYPVVTGVDHLVNLAELTVLVGVLYLLLLAGVAAFSLAGAAVPSSGRALLREFRSSFYRKLALAFVGVAVVPVIALALATRAYFARQLLAEVEESAVQTATVAQRLVEDYAALQNSGPLDVIDDQIMVLVSRAIDQPVNLFDGAELRATSERDLYASRLLPTRTPADVYRGIVLARTPTFVGEQRVGAFRYLVAAAPVRQGNTRGIVTVPQTLRRRESERQRDDLDRRVLSASVLFVLVGLALGYSMAERIADPVNRLTRATRRIARGDLDARIAATSSDELRRLVEDFNQMAADLQRQRRELERAATLEAWADMARQVAHDIKNPLTPIQLSAEHARRINLDRGRPLSPVLDECVTAILTQVKLLRQIAAEFSSFASSPTARPERTDLVVLIEEVLEPYRAGLSDRVVIEVNAPEELAPVSVDRTLFARALTNIVENALHAMPGQGRLSVVCEPTAQRETGRPTVTVRITDTGVGMDAEALARIFEPYFSTKASGTGLGLTIAKRNIELSGGTIALESAIGRGSTVSLTLPLDR